jgi:hypothetical protein
MITLEKPIAQEQKNISSSPLFEELSDESAAASCGGGHIRQLTFAVGGGQSFFNKYIPASWSGQQVYNYAAHVCGYWREQLQTHVDWIG